MLNECVTQLLQYFTLFTHVSGVYVRLLFKVKIKAEVRRDLCF